MTTTDSLINHITGELIGLDKYALVDNGKLIHHVVADTLRILERDIAAGHIAVEGLTVGGPKEKEPAVPRTCYSCKYADRDSSDPPCKLCMAWDKWESGPIMAAPLNILAEAEKMEAMRPKPREGKTLNEGLRPPRPAPPPSPSAQDGAPLEPGSWAAQPTTDDTVRRIYDKVLRIEERLKYLGNNRNDDLVFG